MRIQRSASFILKRMTQGLLRKTTIVTASIIAIAAFAVIGQNLLTHPADSYAAEEIHGCYAFDTDDGTIHTYFNNEGNDGANPACSRDVVIPANIDGIAVAHINSGAFASKALTSVTIPTTVTSIGTAGFIGNNLTSVTIPGSVVSVGTVAFSGNQLTSVLVQSGVVSIGEFSFGDNKLTSVTLEDGLKSIGARAFSNNPTLTSLIIPNGVTSIADETFIQSQLTSVTIPSSVTSIGARAFYDSKLTTLTIPSSVKNIGINAFMNNRLASLTLQDGMSGIGDFAFYNNPLTSVTIPGSAKNIGSYAFAENQLTSLTLQDGITNIGSNVFMDSHLTSLVVPASMVSIGDMAFYANKLSSLIIENGTTSIGSTAFNSNNLTSVSIPGSVKSVGRNAFAGNQLTSLTLHGGTEHIDSYAFAGNQLTSVTIPSSVTSIGSSAFQSNQLTSITLGCGMTTIEDGVFAINRLTSVAIPDCITSIKPTAFFAQNPWGGEVDSSTNPAHYWWSDDPAVVKNVYDNIWYAQLYTATPNNPNHLTDGFATEGWWYGDFNADGDEADSIGTHLINPASLSVTYVDSQNQHLAQTHSSTGKLADNTNLTNYLVKNIELPAVADIDAITPEEQTALDASLSAYHRIGQSVSLNAPVIAGYQQPITPFALLLAGPLTDHAFTYQLPKTETPKPAKPSDTKPTTGQKTQTSPLAVARPATTTPSQPELRAKVDFSAPIGSATGPVAGSVPNGLADVIAKGSLSTDSTKSCAQITSAALLPSTSFTAPDAGAKTLGGLAFTLRCTSDGGDATVTFTFGDTIADISKIKVYKQDGAGKARDITDKVVLTSQTVNGRATLSYSLKDGQDLDDDGEANSSITDPIYLTMAGDSPAPETTVLDQAEPASDTHDNTLLLVVAGSVIGLAVLTFVVVMLRRKKRA